MYSLPTCKQSHGSFNQTDISVQCVMSQTKQSWLLRETMLQYWEERGLWNSLDFPSAWGRRWWWGSTFWVNCFFNIYIGGKRFSINLRLLSIIFHYQMSQLFNFWPVQRKVAWFSLRSCFQSALGRLQTARHGSKGTSGCRVSWCEPWPA